MDYDCFNSKPDIEMPPSDHWVQNKSTANQTICLNYDSLIFTSMHNIKENIYLLKFRYYLYILESTSSEFLRKKFQQQVCGCKCQLW